jgi:hypothetical protein
MVNYQNYTVHDVPIAEAVHKMRRVDPASQLVEIARSVEISFGD